jgi:hypothetical protein
MEMNGGMLFAKVVGVMGMRLMEYLMGYCKLLGCVNSKAISIVIWYFAKQVIVSTTFK